MKDEVLFKCYDVVSVESGNVIGRFKKKYDAEMAVEWLNGSSKTELIRLKPKNITVKDLEEYLLIHRAGLCYKTSEDFINEFKRLLAQMNKSYNLKDKSKKAFVKIDNFWWRLSLTTPLDKATVYNYSGGHMSEIDCTKKEIVEAEDWEFLDWKGTVLYDDHFNTGWLSPSGDFYGCDYRAHYMCALMVLRQDDKKLEEKGYIRITKSINKDELSAQIPYFLNHTYPKPTKKQMDYLAGSKIKNINHLLKEYYKDLEP